MPSFLPHISPQRHVHPPVTAVPCAGRPCCVRPTSPSPSGSTNRSLFSNWPQTPPFGRERAASGWGFAGAGRGPRTPSPPSDETSKQDLDLSERSSSVLWLKVFFQKAPRSHLYVPVLCHLHVTRSPVCQQEEPSLSHGDLAHAAARLDRGGQLEDALAGLNMLQDRRW